MAPATSSGSPTRPSGYNRAGGGRSARAHGMPYSGSMTSPRPSQRPGSGRPGRRRRRRRSRPARLGRCSPGAVFRRSGVRGGHDPAGTGVPGELNGGLPDDTAGLMTRLLPGGEIARTSTTARPHRRGRAQHPAPGRPTQATPTSRSGAIARRACALPGAIPAELGNTGCRPGRPLSPARQRRRVGRRRTRGRHPEVRPARRSEQVERRSWDLELPCSRAPPATLKGVPTSDASASTDSLSTDD